MKPAPFEYAAPGTIDEVLALLAEHGSDAKLLAGGQSLIPAMNFRISSATLLVDLNGVKELDYVTEDAQGRLHIGAMTRQRTIERSSLISQIVPLLFEAVPFIAHPQIRNRGTIGGSLAHADPAAELPVVASTLNAEMIVKSTDGQRVIKSREFFHGMFTVDIRPDELLTEVIFPAAAKHSGTAFMEVARRRGDYAMMGVAACVQLDSNGLCESASLYYLNAGDRPIGAPEAAQMLAGKMPQAALLAEVSQRASQDDIEPFGNVHASVEYQRHLAQVLTTRALGMAFERAGATHDS